MRCKYAAQAARVLAQMRHAAKPRDQQSAEPQAGASEDASGNEVVDAEKKPDAGTEDSTRVPSRVPSIKDEA